MNHSQRIMAAVDFSPQSQEIIDHACQLAEKANAELHVVYVETRSAASNGDATRLGLQRLALMIRPDDEIALTTQKKILNGIPHRALVDYAKSHAIDLIVMGTHGRKGLSHMALGSVAERVLRDAPCPVQVLKSPEPVSRRLNEAAEALIDSFGEELKGTLVETEQKIRLSICENLSVTDTIADDVLHQLKELKWATWEPLNDNQGTWSFLQTVEFVEVDDAFEAAASSSPATELISRARKLRATDIHVDPVDHTESRVRLRIDGQLSEYCRMDREVTDHLINQWKMMANLDISEPFKPKEGRIEFPPTSPEFLDTEARLTVAPVAGGDAVAIRLFSRESVFIPLGELGLDPSAQSSVDDMLRRAEGLILVTGPTGSGKSTTVYSMLESISSSGMNIVSIEDPVEFSVPFARQMEVDERHGITMTEGLKTMLRMDPDVVFLGEIRDAAAADIAMRAASSGHYVFSTLHTRDVASVITALRDLGLPDRSMAANISGIVNQRLVRRLCLSCRRAVELTQETCDMLDRHGIAVPDQIYEPEGCTDCRETGYRSRIGIFEAVTVKDEVRAAIAAGAHEAELRELLADRGMVSLNMDSLEKVAEGITDLDEALRVRWLV